MNGNILKKLTAIAVSFTVLCCSVSAAASGEYYKHRDLPQVTEADLEYKKCDTAEMEKSLSQVLALCGKSGKKDEIIRLADKCMQAYYDACNSYALATLGFDRSMSASNSKALDEAGKAAVSGGAILSKLIYGLYDSEYRYVLNELFGDAETALYMALPDDEEVNRLLEKEQELVLRHSELYGDSDALAELYIELLSVRNELAKHMGYDNYADYANDVMYDRTIADEDIESFYNYVSKYISPLLIELTGAWVQTEYIPIHMTDDDILLNTRMVMRGINQELGEAFDYLIANNLYDIAVRENKNESNGSYTVFLPEKQVPFVFINRDMEYEQGGSDSVHTMIHEFGHFAAMLNSPEADIPYSSILLSQSIDTSEVQSQGLEVLSERYYGRMFGDSAAWERYLFMLNIIDSVVSGCMINEWETQAYRMGKPTVDKLNTALQAIMQKYGGIGLGLVDFKEMWTEIPHNYTMPMYYLSYALSGMTALGLYSESVDDYEGAVDKYMQISAAGVYKDFAELTADYGLCNIYAEDTVRKIAADIRNTYAIGYSDIPQDAWYKPYIYTVSNVIHGRAENTFMPEIPITRSEFVGAVGRLYDYYTGIEGEYENTFSDIGSGDENMQYIAWASENGIATGYNDLVFGGNDTLTREQAAAVIYRLTDDRETVQETDIFADFETVSDWAKEPVLWAAQNGIINGRDNGEFDPAACITRAEAAKLLSEYIYSQY